MSKFTLDHIGKVLARHPSECVFELDAPTKILQRLNDRGLNDFDYILNGDKELIARWKQCWVESEIYCPHEGINRLAECGVKSLEWELV
jgi:hypothetical protein